MYLKTIQAAAIKTLFEVLKDIINDVNVIFERDGVYMTTLDTAHVTFISMQLHGDNLEKYECSSRTLAGLNLLNTFKIMKTITNNDTLTLEINDKQELMDIKIENENKKTTTTFKLKLLDINDEVYENPSINMDYTTIIPSGSFQRIIRDMSSIADNVTIKRFENKLAFICDGDFAQQETVFECSDTIEDVIEFPYMLKYLHIFTKATNICSNIEIMQSRDGPIAFKYSIANLGEVTFFLAHVSD
jgi:proliferating cell nuclear antigen